MKVLLMSCNTGEGHNNAALAVKVVLEKKGVQCDFFDSTTLRKQKSQKFVSTFHNQFITGHPKGFGRLYRAGILYDASHIVSPVYLFNAANAKKLNAYIKSHDYDAVVCAHLYPMHTVTKIKKKYGLDIPTFGITTDYTYFPFLRESRLDYYCIPHSDLIPEMVKKGMNAKSLYATGIPINPKFRQPIEKDDARELLGMPHDKKITLVMMGGLGCGNIDLLCEVFEKKRNDDEICYVLTGRNEELRNRLNETYKDGTVVTVPYTDKVHLYLKASDVLITKPGGLASTEAAISNIPIVNLLSLLGIEESNGAFYAKKGMSVIASSIDNAVDLAVDICRHPEKGRTLMENQRRFIKTNSAETIAAMIMSTVQNNRK